MPLKIYLLKICINFLNHFIEILSVAVKFIDGLFEEICSHPFFNQLFYYSHLITRIYLMSHYWLPIVRRIAFECPQRPFASAQRTNEYPSAGWSIRLNYVPVQPIIGPWLCDKGIPYRLYQPLRDTTRKAYAAITNKWSF